jgi:hypothetical protein
MGLRPRGRYQRVAAEAKPSRVIAARRCWPQGGAPFQVQAAGDGLFWLVETCRFCCPVLQCGPKSDRLCVCRRKNVSARSYESHSRQVAHCRPQFTSYHHTGAGAVGFGLGVMLRDQGHGPQALRFRAPIGSKANLELGIKLLARVTR